MIIISPFFDENDKRNIDQAINQCIKEKEIIYQDLVLNTFFKQDLFYKTEKAFTKEQAISFLANKFKEKNLVEEGFEQSVLQREESSSTCFFQSFAIPHGVKFLGKKTRFAILISEKGINWDNNIIHLVLMISIKFSDRKIFMTIYNTIIRALQSKEKVDKLAKCDDISQFINIIRNNK